MSVENRIFYGQSKLLVNPEAQSMPAGISGLTQPALQSSSRVKWYCELGVTSMCQEEVGIGEVRTGMPPTLKQTFFVGEHRMEKLRVKQDCATKPQATFVSSGLHS